VKKKTHACKCKKERNPRRILQEMWSVAAVSSNPSQENWSRNSSPARGATASSAEQQNIYCRACCARMLVEVRCCSVVAAQLRSQAPQSQERKRDGHGGSGPPRRPAIHYMFLVGSGGLVAWGKLPPMQWCTLG
jgi:hypothetical protein